ncbi:MAG: hypothetical protein J6I50_00270 [Clostridia bacterium]|nr:hypothetical protein [Clostridia bacterium]
MMNLKNRTALFLLAILTVSLAATACSDASDKGNENTDVKGTGTAGMETEAVSEPSEEDVRRAVSDNIPELDFNGTHFRSMTQDSTVNDIWVEAETGDVLDDAIYYRNRAVEERFNIQFDEVLAVSFNDISSYVKKAVSAGDDAYDLVIGQMEQTGQDALGGYYKNWYDLPYVNFNQPWYPSSLVKEATVNDKMYIIASDLSLSYTIYTYCVYYNKALASQYDIPDLYAMVDDGKWTIDQMFSLAKEVYVDSDSSNNVSEDDTFGMFAALDGCTVSAYFYGFGQPYASIKNNAISMDVNSEKTVEALGVLRDNLFNNDHVWTVTEGITTMGAAEAFAKGRYLFSPSILKYSLYQVRESDFEWGILPFPKWNEEQDSYYSAIDAGSSVLTVPTTAANTEMIGAVVEALSAESWKSVMPTFYDTVMDSKIANDEGTVRMLDTIFNSRVIDFAYLYDGWNGWVFKMQSLLVGNSDFASFYAKNEKAVSKHYEKVLDIFLKELE